MKTQSLKILKINTTWLLAGIILLLLGNIILSVNPMGQTYEKTVFAWNKITLAPILILGGYLVLGVSIFKTAAK